MQMIHAESWELSGRTVRPVGFDDQAITRQRGFRAVLDTLRYSYIGIFHICMVLLRAAGRRARVGHA